MDANARPTGIDRRTALRRLTSSGIALAATAMGALLWLSAGLVPSEAHGLIRFIALGLQIAAGIAVYGLLLQILGVASWREAANALKRPA